MIEYFYVRQSGGYKLESLMYLKNIQTSSGDKL